MMCVEITVVSQCRVGLAPTARLGNVSLMAADVQAATGTSVRARLPWVAMSGSHRWPVVTTAWR